MGCLYNAHIAPPADVRALLQTPPPLPVGGVAAAWGMSWGMNHGVPPPAQQVQKDLVKAELPGDGHSR